MEKCTHRWKISTQYDREKRGWEGVCAGCGASKLFPLRDFAESENYRYWRRGPTAAGRTEL